VADSDNNRIEVLHEGGHYISSWGTAGMRPGQFQGPGSVIIDEEKKIIFVADIRNNRIQEFDIQGNFIKEWGGLGSADGQFDHPGDIALNPDKEILYVTDIYNNRIQSFYYDGNFITKWGSFGTGNGQFDRPAGITINPKDNTVYVSDTANNRIQKFDSVGNFITKWGSLGNADGNFARPDGIRYEPSHESIYVADRQNHRIQVFDGEGQFVTKWMTSSLKGILIKPRDVDLDSSGQIYVVDKDNSNVLVYKLSNTVPIPKVTRPVSPQTENKGIATLHINVKNANPEAGNVQISAFGVTKDQKNTNFDKKTFVSIDKLIKNYQSKEFEVTSFKFNLGKDVPLGGFINACYDATGKPKGFQGGCNYIQLTDDAGSYTITLDMKDFRQY
jgi:DNA-binding beta-propeller fold protein YncE